MLPQIAADMGRFTDTNEVIINTEVRSIDVTKKGVYFAFRDQVKIWINLGFFNGASTLSITTFGIPKNYI